MISTSKYLSFGVTNPLIPTDALKPRKQYLRDSVDSGFPYSRKLSSHLSCVNAITFSRGDGRWLASAGDDPFVYLWDFHQDDLIKPTCGYIGHRANVFALAFSASNQFLYTGDTDGAILKYDVSHWPSYLDTPGEPVTTLKRHTESIRALSSHPENDDLLLSAGDDGAILFHDFRSPTGSRAQGRLFGGPGFTGVQHHPTMPNLFVTGDAYGDITLRDVRMSFDSWTLERRGLIHEYVSALSKRPLQHLVRAEIGSLCFDKTGTKLGVTFLHFLPTIYALMDPYPIAVCSGRNLPDGTPVPQGERTYSNSCTIKHGSFGGPGLNSDEYYSTGSDDFRGYIWKIPDIAILQESRQVVSADVWDSDGGPSNIVGFAANKNKERFIPVELPTPLYRLGGHKSIVNSTLMHPSWPLMVTSGVERNLTLHSPFPNSPCTSGMSLTTTAIRELPPATEQDHRRYVRAITSGRGAGDDDDRETIALFDEILRREGGGNVFDIRTPWDPDSEDEQEEIEANPDLGIGRYGRDAFV